MNSIGVSHIHGTAIGADSSERVIDACVHPIGNGQYKMWYKDENHDSYTYIAISNDLYHWDVCGKEIDYNSHEGPNVFELGGKKWMITDEWNGLGVYETQDYTHWERQGYILLYASEFSQ